MRECGVGLDAIVKAIAIVIAMNRFLLMQTRTGEKFLNFAYRLSVIGVRRAAGNGLGRGRPTRERGQ